MKKKVILIGGDGTTAVIAEQIEDANKNYGMDIEVLGFAIDDKKYNGSIAGWPILCGVREVYDKYKDDESVYFVFSLHKRNLFDERIQLRESLGIPNERFLTFIHPGAKVSKSAKIGHGNIILSGCDISTSASIGNYNFILSASIHHDTAIGNENFMAGGVTIGSRSKVGNCNYFCIRCVIIQKAKIEDYTFIGAGSLVIRNLKTGVSVFGNPAKKIVF